MGECKGPDHLLNIFINNCPLRKVDITASKNYVQLNYVILACLATYLAILFQIFQINLPPSLEEEKNNFLLEIV